jgi:hypothetical protein
MRGRRRRAAALRPSPSRGTRRYAGRASCCTQSHCVHSSTPRFSRGCIGGCSPAGPNGAEWRGAPVGGSRGTGDREEKGVWRHLSRTGSRVTMQHTYAMQRATWHTTVPNRARACVCGGVPASTGLGGSRANMPRHSTSTAHACGTQRNATQTQAQVARHAHPDAQERRHDARE